MTTPQSAPRVDWRHLGTEEGTVEECYLASLLLGWVNPVEVRARIHRTVDGSWKYFVYSQECDGRKVWAIHHRYGLPGVSLATAKRRCRELMLHRRQCPDTRGTEWLSRG